jgi:hypothetical protein
MPRITLQEPADIPMLILSSRGTSTPTLAELLLYRSRLPTFELGDFGAPSLGSSDWGAEHQLQDGSFTRSLGMILSWLRDAQAFQQIRRAVLLRGQLRRKLDQRILGLTCEQDRKSIRRYPLKLPIFSYHDAVMARSRKLSFTIVLAGGLHVLNPASAQNINDFQRPSGGAEWATQREWPRLPQREISCLDKTLRQQGGNVNDLINRGVMPSDPRLSQLRSNCRRQIAQRPQPVTAQSPVPVPVTAQPRRYVVEGVALGDRVRFEDKTNRQFQCIPSEFSGLTWCYKEDAQDNTKLGKVISSNSILYTRDGKAVYANSYVEPALITPNDVRKQIDRLSAKFGEHAREFRMPHREGFPDAVIAIWGKIQLEPLDPNDAMVASGRSPKGLLVGFIDGLQHEAKAGVPVFRLAGGAGFLWGATFSDNGRGAQRFLTIDASKIASPMSTNYPLRELSEPHISTTEPVPASPPITPDASASQVTSAIASDNPVKSPNEEQADAPTESDLATEIAGVVRGMDTSDPVRPTAEDPDSNGTDAAAARSENLKEPRSQNLGLISILTIIVLLGVAITVLFVGRHNSKKRGIPVAPTAILDHTNIYRSAQHGLCRFWRTFSRSAPILRARQELLGFSDDPVSALRESLRHIHSKRSATIRSPAVNRIERAAGVALPIECTSSDNMKTVNMVAEPSPWHGNQASMNNESKSELSTTAGNHVSKSNLYSSSYSGGAVVREVENPASTAISSDNRKVEPAVTTSEKIAHLVLPTEAFDGTMQSADESVRPQLALVSKRSIGPENKNRLLTTGDGSPIRNEVATASHIGEASAEIGSEKNASENAIVEKGLQLAKLYAVGNPSNEELSALKLLILQAFAVYRVSRVEKGMIGPGPNRSTALSGLAARPRTAV